MDTTDIAVWDIAHVKPEIPTLGMDIRDWDKKIIASVT